MIVARAELSTLALTLKRPLRTARRELRVREGWLLALHVSGADGRVFVGLGEATPHPFCAEVELAATERVLRELTAALKGVTVPADVSGVEALVASFGALRAVPSARHAVECALLDAVAQGQGVPLAALLDPHIEDAGNRSVEVNALLVEDAPDALAAEARRAVHDGFRTVKVKVGLGAEPDAARLQAVRDAIGHEVRLRIDANGAWSLDEAQVALQRLARFGLELCEQPVPAMDVHAMRALRADAPCRIAADEAAVSEAAVRELFSETDAAADVLVVRPMVLGGLLPALRCARWAQARGAAVYVASGLDGLHARAAATHLAVAMGKGELAHGLAVGALFEGAQQAYAPVRGHLTLPAGAGLGLGVGFALESSPAGEGVA